MRLSRKLTLLTMMILVTACSSGSDDGSSDDLLSPYDVSGSIGDGPIVGADITVVDANGGLVTTSTSSQQAGYSVAIPADTPLPVTVSVSGGTDLVTQRPADFELVSIIHRSGAQTVNVSPLTTLLVKAAECAGGTTDARLASLTQTMATDLNIGLDSSVLGNPLSDTVDNSNIETAVLANEALGEWIRRIGGGLAGIELDQVMDTLACDLADGAIDGRLMRSVGDDDARVIAVAKAVEVGIRLEVLAGRLQVDGQDATAAMNQAIRSVAPNFTDADVGSVPVDPAAIAGAVAAIGVLQGAFPDQELVDLMVVLSTAGSANVGSLIDGALDVATQNTLQGLPQRVALADTTAIDDLTTRAGAQAASLAPIVSLSADAADVDADTSVTLSWASSNADQCVSDGAWNGPQALQGTFVTAPLSESVIFELICMGVGGVTQSAVVVIVDGQPLANPTPTPGLTSVPIVSFSANAAVVNPGASVELTWSSQNADTCTASGGWSGTKNTAGQQTFASIQSNQTFNLSCSGAVGSAVAMVSVSVVGALQVSWQAPTENVDGTPISGLSLYRIHYGSSSGSYDDFVEVTGSASSHTLDLVMGQYYVAMTAIDLEGDESALSNEVVKQSL